MVTLETLQDDIYRGAKQQYKSEQVINLYQSPKQEGLVTQTDVGDPIRILEVSKDQSALRITSCKDDYPGWIAADHLAHLSVSTTPYQSPVLSTEEIASRLPQVIAFTKDAMAAPNEYLWGGATAPNYDCSGLMQAAFASVEVRLPRDSYQQEDFTQKVDRGELAAGDLVFFGTPERTTHVGLYLGDGSYIHSSGKEKGRNGIGIDSIDDLSHPVSVNYYALLRCFGRVVRSYQSAN